MDEYLHLNKLMDESLEDSRREDSLLHMLTETIRRLETVRRGGDHHNGAVGGRKCTGEEAGRGGGVGMHGASDEATLGAAKGEAADEDADAEWEEEECKHKALVVLRELSVLHSDRVTAWRAALRECACMLAKSPPGGSDQQNPSTTESKITPSSDSFSDTFLSVGEEIQNIMEKLNTIKTKLDKEILKSGAGEASTVDAALQDPKASEQPEDDTDRPNSHDALRLDTGRKQGVEDGDAMPECKFSKSDCRDVEETGEGLVIKSQGCDSFVSSDSLTGFMEELHENGKEEAHKDWITVGLTGQQERSDAGVPHACFIKAPTGAAEVLKCELADALSCLMVTGSEELVSRVIRVKVRDGTNFHFPVMVVVPFCAQYRGSYRDIAVKMVDGEGRASYTTPVTTEGTYGGQRGSFAEVRVYSLGLFAVISCLKRENYTVPRKGLSLKLPMDPRICLNYLPRSFATPIMAQTMIQPLDAVLLAAVKSRSDAYHSVVSTSPLLYLTHPSSQRPRRPLTLTLPCPPNPDKKRLTRGQQEVQDQQPGGASPPWDHPPSHRRRILAASVKSKETSEELLVALCSRDKQWGVLDNVTVRNQQNGLVSFELTENFDRLLVMRLLAPLQPSYLASLAEELEESVCCHSVTVVLQRREDEPHAVLAAALSSRELNWELSKLRAQGYSVLPGTSSEITMCEGDQLLLRFSGNITSTGAGTQNDAPEERLTFHSQQKNHLLVHLTEVDPFGNHSSPHYKGTALFYKVTRGQLEWRGHGPEPVDAKLLGDPVCKLPLTLPKKVRTINRPIMSRVRLCKETESLPDSLLLWLSEELSEEEVGLLVLSLRLRRSAAQLVKLRAGDCLSAQAFHVLAMWRRGLPAAPHQPKASQLAHCLAKSGRPDLARELLLRQAVDTRQDPLKQGSMKTRNHTAF